MTILAYYLGETLLHLTEQLVILVAIPTIVHQRYDLQKHFEAINEFYHKLRGFKTSLLLIMRYSYLAMQ